MVWGQTDCSLQGIYNISKLSGANECIDVNGFGKTNGDNGGGLNIWARFFVIHSIFYKLDNGLGSNWLVLYGESIIFLSSLEQTNA